MIDRYASLLSAHVIVGSEQMTREPEGVLKYPYLVPGSPDSPYYSDQLWDWDSWWMSAFLGQVEAQTGEPGRFARFEEGCILNFLDHTTDDGVMPIQIIPQGRFRYGDFASEEAYARHQNTHKPVIAQHAALLARRRGDAEWLRPHLPKLWSSAACSGTASPTTPGTWRKRRSCCSDATWRPTAACTSSTIRTAVNRS
jgi:putative isomerase